jgi:hypothetical protein
MIPYIFLKNHFKIVLVFRSFINIDLKPRFRERPEGAAVVEAEAQQEGKEEEGQN